MGSTIPALCTGLLCLAYLAVNAGTLCGPAYPIAGPLACVFLGTLAVINLGFYCVRIKPEPTVDPTRESAEINRGKGVLRPEPLRVLGVIAMMAFATLLWAAIPSHVDPRALQKLQHGMTEDQVIAILGEPQRRVWSSGGPWVGQPHWEWHYTRGFYEPEILQFDTSGRLR